MKTYTLVLLLLISSIKSLSQQFEISDSKPHMCARVQQTLSNARVSLENPEAPSDELAEEMRKYDLTYYQFNLNLDNTSKFIQAEVDISASTISDLKDFKIQFSDSMKIKEVYLEGLKIDNYRHENDIFSISDLNISTGNVLNIKLKYSGSTPYRKGVFYETTSSGKTVTYTVTEPFEAFYWFPSKQLLEDKIDSIDYHFTTDAHLKVGSNGLLKSTKEIGNNKVKIHWKSSHPIAYYLVSFSVSDYYEYNLYSKPKALNGDSILIQNYLINDDWHRSNAEKLSTTQRAMELLSDKFGLYPFSDEKYGHTFWVNSPWSGMEHQTMSAVGSFASYLQVHELAHQWFGCDVTSKDWRGIWLHEGFASYSEYIALEEYLPGAMADQLENWAERAKKESEASIFIPESEKKNGNVIFNGGITYAKGPLAVHLLRYWIGSDELFFKGLRKYLKDFSGKSVSVTDFQNVMEDVSGKDLSDFFEQWIYGAGYPNYEVDYTILDKRKLRLDLVQDQKGTEEFFRIPTIELGIKFKGKEKIHIEKITQNNPNQSFEFDYEAEIEHIILDPSAWVMKDVNYHKSVKYSKGFVLTNKDIKNTSFQIKPIPSNGKFNINWSSDYKGYYTWEIFDLKGKLVNTGSGVKPTKKYNKLIQINLDKGIYIFKVKEGLKMITQKKILINP